MFTSTYEKTLHLIFNGTYVGETETSQVDARLVDSRVDLILEKSTLCELWLCWHIIDFYDY